MNPESRNPGRWAKWTLFVVLLLTVPVPYIMLVVGGIVPTFCIVYLAAHGLIIGLIIGLFLASTFEIYRLPRHNSAPPANLLHIFQKFTK